MAKVRFFFLFFVAFFIFFFFTPSNAAEIPLGYQRGAASGYWYFKLYTEPKTWHEANLVCESQNARLAIINSMEEANLYMAELAKYPDSSLPGNFNKNCTSVGFDRLVSGSWLAINGVPLSQTGYDKWGQGEPNNLYNKEACGTIFRSGLLNDAPCDMPFMYICESTRPYDLGEKLDAGLQGYQRGMAAGYWYYKLYTTPRMWYEANMVCETENARLAIINSEEEAQIYVREIAKDQDTSLIGKGSISVGFHNRVNDTWLTLDGLPLAQAGYDQWGPGEPSNDEGVGNCGTIFRNGLLNDVPCNVPLMFICETRHPYYVEEKKKCVRCDEGYKRNTASPVEKYYKFNLTPRTWEEALVVCQSQRATLAMITSDAEAKMYVDEFAKHPALSIPGSFNKEWASLGFHNRLEPSKYVTIKGVPLTTTGYNKWMPGEPNNAGGVEKCGSMHRTGLLNDIPCTIPGNTFMFICEFLP